MGKIRPGRVQEAIRQEISLILQNNIKDPRIGFITVTKVDLAPDLRFAKVFFSVLGDMKAKQLALKGLNSAKGYIRGALSDKIKLRFTPDIAFKIDDSVEKAGTVLEILDKLEKERKERESGNRGDKKA